MNFLTKISEALKGKRTILAVVVTLVLVPFLNEASKYNISAHLQHMLIDKFCNGEMSGSCFDLAKSLSHGVQELYLGVVAAVLVYLRTKTDTPVGKK